MKRTFALPLAKVLLLGGLFFGLESPQAFADGLTPICVQGTGTFGPNCTSVSVAQPFPVALAPSALSGSSVAKLLSAANLNPTLVKASQGALLGLYAVNTNAAVAYLKLSNSASAPTCGTTPVVMTIPLVQNVPVALALGYGVSFSAGIAFCITGAQADADTTNATTGISVNITYQ